MYRCVNSAYFYVMFLTFVTDEKTIDAIKLHQSSQPTSMPTATDGLPDQSEMSVSDDDETNGGARSSESAQHSQFDDDEFDVIASRMKFGNSSKSKGKYKRRAQSPMDESSSDGEDDILDFGSDNADEENGCEEENHNERRGRPTVPGPLRPIFAVPHYC